MTRQSINSRRKQLLVDFLRQVWDEGNAEACEEFLAPLYTIHHDPGDPWAGPPLDLAGYQARLRISRAPFPDQSFDIVGLFEDDDVIVATWHCHATRRGAVAGFAPTGKRITMSGITAHSFTDSRISGRWQVVDRLGVYQQLQSQRSDA